MEINSPNTTTSQQSRQKELWTRKQAYLRVQNVQLHCEPRPSSQYDVSVAHYCKRFVSQRKSEHVVEAARRSMPAHTCAASTLGFTASGAD
jgi:hypothetical protein